MSDTSTGPMSSVRVQHEQSIDSDTTSVTSLPHITKVPPPYPGHSNKKPARQTESHHNSPKPSHSSQSSPSSSAIDTMKHRIHMLEVENRRLMSSQAQLVVDTNKRVEMQMADMSALREELKRVQHTNKELRDLCAFLDEDRRKVRQLSNEWHKFGKYTTGVMQQEVRAYQNKVCEMDERQRILEGENDELKSLCLYLDEQRQTMIRERDLNCGNPMRLPAIARDSNPSVACDSSGCGSAASPATSQDEDDSAGSSHMVEPANGAVDQKQERALRMITQQMQTSICDTHESETEQARRGSVTPNDCMLEYMQSLENRIRHLELNHHNSPTGEHTVVERDYSNGVSDDSIQSFDLDEVSYTSTIPSVKNTKPAVANNDAMFESTSTMTSSGTTYCSSMTDESADRAVLVMGDETDMEGVNLLEVRTLGPIDEEHEEDLSSGTYQASRSTNASGSDKMERISMKEDMGQNRTKEDIGHIKMRQDIGQNRTGEGIRQNWTNDNFGQSWAKGDIVQIQIRQDIGQHRSQQDICRKKTQEVIGQNRTSANLGQNRTKVEIGQNITVEPVRNPVSSPENSPTGSALTNSAEHHKEEDALEGSYIEMPPRIEPVSESVCRLSLCSSDISSEGVTPKRHSTDITLLSPNQGDTNSIVHISDVDESPERVVEDYDSVNGRDSLAEAVEVLRVHEMAARRSMRGLSTQETAIVQHMCQMAWNSLDRKSHTFKTVDSQDRGTKSHMTTV